jgi:hypothetical protein
VSGESASVPTGLTYGCFVDAATGQSKDGRMDQRYRGELRTATDTNARIVQVRTRHRLARPLGPHGRFGSWLCENQPAGRSGARLIRDKRRSRMNESPIAHVRFFCCAMTTASSVFTHGVTRGLGLTRRRTSRSHAMACQASPELPRRQRIGHHRELCFSGDDLCATADTSFLATAQNRGCPLRGRLLLKKSLW